MTVHFQTSPLLDFPSSVKFTTIFQSPEAKTPECHLIFFSRYKILQILPIYFFVFYATHSHCHHSASGSFEKA